MKSATENGWGKEGETSEKRGLGGCDTALVYKEISYNISQIKLWAKE